MPTTRKSATDIDRHVGRRILEQRILVGMTQTQLAAATGVTYQQHLKREKGQNRISADALYRIAQTLGVEVGYFFEGLGEPAWRTAAPRSTLRVAQAFSTLPAHQRRIVAQLVYGLAREET